MGDDLDVCFEDSYDDEAVVVFAGLSDGFAGVVYCGGAPCCFYGVEGEGVGAVSVADRRLANRVDCRSGPRQENYCAVQPPSTVRMWPCLLYTSPSPRDLSTSRMPSSA